MKTVLALITVTGDCMSLYKMHQWRTWAAPQKTCVTANGNSV